MNCEYGLFSSSAVLLCGVLINSDCYWLLFIL